MERTPANPTLRTQGRAPGWLRLFVAAAVAATVTLSFGCGGDDDIKDVQATATAAAKSRPSPTAADAVADYRAKVSAGLTRLSTAAETLNNDMLAAEQAQADIKFALLLPADANAVAAAVDELRQLKSPTAAYEAFATKLNPALDRLSAAADLMKAAVLKADPVAGEQAFNALTEGRKLLDEAKAAFPPS